MSLLRLSKPSWALLTSSRISASALKTLPNQPVSGVRSYSGSELPDKPARSNGQNYDQNRQNRQNSGRRNNNYNNYNNYNNRGNNGGRRGNRSNNNRSENGETFNRSPASAYSEEISEFHERLTLSNQRNAQGSADLVDIQIAMQIYSELLEIPRAVDAQMTTSLIQALHASARVSVRAMSGVISSERKASMNEQAAVLAGYLEKIGENILSGKAWVTRYGLMQYFTAFSTLRRPARGLELYEQFRNSENEAIANISSSGRVMGSVFHVMINAGTPLEDIEKFYLEIRERDISDINIEHNMVRAYIFNDRVADALKLYSNVLRTYPVDGVTESYLARIHEAFIGDCTDVAVAKGFFNEAIKGDAPYEVHCHPSAVARLLDRVYIAHEDPDEIVELWSGYLGSVRKFRESNYNVVSFTMLKLFFRKYPEVTEEAYEKLKNIITAYNDTRSRMSSLFLNGLLSTASQQWKNEDVIFGIIDSYDLYDLPKREDTLRIILNSFAHVDVETTLIQKYWDQRHELDTPLEKFDLYALAKACNRPERIDHFVSQWQKFLESGPSRNQVHQVLQYLRIPSNNLGAIYKAVAPLSDLGLMTSDGFLTQALRDSATKPEAESSPETPAAETTETTLETEPAESTEAAEAAEATESAESESIESTESTESAESTETVDTTPETEAPETPLGENPTSPENPGKSA